MLEKLWVIKIKGKATWIKYISHLLQSWMHKQTPYLRSVRFTFSYELYKKAFHLVKEKMGF